jgi:hypothetical protein
MKSGADFCPACPSFSSVQESSWAGAKLSIEGGFPRYGHGCLSQEVGFFFSPSRKEKSTLSVLWNQCPRSLHFGWSGSRVPYLGSGVDGEGVGVCKDPWFRRAIRACLSSWFVWAAWGRRRFLAPREAKRSLKVSSKVKNWCCLITILSMRCCLFRSKERVPSANLGGWAVIRLNTKWPMFEGW